MQALKNVRIKKTGFVKIFREDLDSVLALISENFERVEIQDDDFKYDSLDEFQGQKGDEVETITLKGYRPGLFSFEAKKGGECMSSSTGEPIPNEVQARIEEIIQRRVKPEGKWFRYDFWINLSIVMPLVLTGMAIYFGSYVLGLLLVAIWLGTLISVRQKNKRDTAIKMVKSHDLQTFWNRNSDKVIIGVACTIIGSFVTWSLRFLIQ